MVGFDFLPQILGYCWEPMNAICCSMNVDGVMGVFGGSGNTSTLHIIIKRISIFCTDR